MTSNLYIGFLQAELMSRSFRTELGINPKTKYVIPLEEISEFLTLAQELLDKNFVPKEKLESAFAVKFIEPGREGEDDDFVDPFK